MHPLLLAAVIAAAPADPPRNAIRVVATELAFGLYHLQYERYLGDRHAVAVRAVVPSAQFGDLRFSGGWGEVRFRGFFFPELQGPFAMVALGAGVIHLENTATGVSESSPFFYPAGLVGYERSFFGDHLALQAAAGLMYGSHGLMKFDRSKLQGPAAGLAPALELNVGFRF
jgi:hypothetical protein